MRRGRGPVRASGIVALAAAGVLGCAADLAGLARAASNQPPIDGAKAWQTECGACHMAYPPQLLPERSWRKLMLGLANHFDEDASLDAATAGAVAGFLGSHAADSVNGDPEFLRGLKPTDTPLRITDTPIWRAIHRRLLTPGVGTGPGIRTAANCTTCHRAGGGLEDD
jgi:hypothetical protein